MRPPESDTVRAAARLLALGLTPLRRPSNDPEYDRLVRRYLDEPELATVARDVAFGLGLRVLDVSEFGVVLGVGADSPFVLTVADYKTNLSGEERLIHGLVQVGLAAYLYPRAEDLESDAEIKQVSVNDLDTFLREACAVVARQITDETDAPADAPEIERAMRIYARWPASKETSDGRRAPKTTQGIIAAALERLADAGLLRRAGAEAGTTYQALRRYRVQVRELAAHEALAALRKATE